MLLHQEHNAQRRWSMDKPESLILLELGTGGFVFVFVFDMSSIFFVTHRVFVNVWRRPMMGSCISHFERGLSCSSES